MGLRSAGDLLRRCLAYRRSGSSCIEKESFLSGVVASSKGKDLTVRELIVTRASDLQ